MKRVIVLGTGTDVGKTYVCRSVLEALSSEMGRNDAGVLGLKPIETGLPSASYPSLPTPHPGAIPDPLAKTTPALVTPGSPTEGSDSHTLWSASSSLPRTGAPLYGFEPPISPHLAAREAGVGISLQRCAEWVLDHESTLAAHYDALHSVSLVETAGGVFSPISPSATNLDLALALDPAPWLLVAPDSLGVLHSVTASCRAMAAAARPPDLVVLSAPATPDASTGSNAAELMSLGIAPRVLGLGRDAPATSVARWLLGRPLS